MPAPKPTCGTASCNLIDPRIAEAIERKALAAAELVRAEGHLDAMISALASNRVTEPVATDLDERAAADVVGVSLATFRRAKVEADYFAGTRPRWRDPDSVRAKFASRGKVATTPAAKQTVRSEDDALDVNGALGRAGLRAVGGRR